MTLSDLKPSIFYVFEVRAVSRAGTGHPAVVEFTIAGTYKIHFDGMSEKLLIWNIEIFIIMYINKFLVFSLFFHKFVV